ncbi:MAG: hypothetical protein JSV34_05730, partial [Candidatus Omnitrophota bacterium]
GRVDLGKVDKIVQQWDVLKIYLKNILAEAGVSKLPFNEKVKIVEQKLSAMNFTPALIYIAVHQFFYSNTYLSLDERLQSCCDLLRSRAPPALLYFYVSPFQNALPLSVYSSLFAQNNFPTITVTIDFSKDKKSAKVIYQEQVNAEERARYETQVTVFGKLGSYFINKNQLLPWFASFDEQPTKTVYHGITGSSAEFKTNLFASGGPNNRRNGTTVNAQYLSLWGRLVSLDSDVDVQEISKTIASASVYNLIGAGGFGFASMGFAPGYYTEGAIAIDDDGQVTLTSDMAVTPYLASFQKIIVRNRKVTDEAGFIYQSLKPFYQYSIISSNTKGVRFYSRDGVKAGSKLVDSYFVTGLFISGKVLPLNSEMSRYSAHADRQNYTYVFNSPQKQGYIIFDYSQPFYDDNLANNVFKDEKVTHTVIGGNEDTYIPDGVIANYGEQGEQSVTLNASKDFRIAYTSIYGPGASLIAAPGQKDTTTYIAGRAGVGSFLDGKEYEYDSQVCTKENLVKALRSKGIAIDESKNAFSVPAEAGLYLVGKFVVRISKDGEYTYKEGTGLVSLKKTKASKQLIIGQFSDTEETRGRRKETLSEKGFLPRKIFYVHEQGSYNVRSIRVFFQEIEVMLSKSDSLKVGITNDISLTQNKRLVLFSESAAIRQDLKREVWLPSKQINYGLLRSEYLPFNNPELGPYLNKEYAFSLTVTGTVSLDELPQDVVRDVINNHPTLMDNGRVQTRVYTQELLISPSGLLSESKACAREGEFIGESFLHDFYRVGANNSADEAANPYVLEPPYSTNCQITPLIDMAGLIVYSVRNSQEGARLALNIGTFNTPATVNLSKAVLTLPQGSRIMGIVADEKSAVTSVKTLKGAKYQGSVLGWGSFVGGRIEFDSRGLIKDTPGVEENVFYPGIDSALFIQTIGAANSSGNIFSMAVKEYFEQAGVSEEDMVITLWSGSKNPQISIKGEKGVRKSLRKEKFVEATVSSLATAAAMAMEEPRGFMDASAVLPASVVDLVVEGKISERVEDVKTHFYPRYLQVVDVLIRWVSQIRDPKMVDKLKKSLTERERIKEFLFKNSDFIHEVIIEDILRGATKSMFEDDFDTKMQEVDSNLLGTYEGRMYVFSQLVGLTCSGVVTKEGLAGSGIEVKENTSEERIKDITQGIMHEKQADIVLGQDEQDVILSVWEHFYDGLVIKRDKKQQLGAFIFEGPLQPGQARQWLLNIGGRIKQKHLQATGEKLSYKFKSTVINKITWIKTSNIKFKIKKLLGWFHIKVDFDLVQEDVSKLSEEKQEQIKCLETFLAKSDRTHSQYQQDKDLDSFRINHAQLVCDYGKAVYQINEVNSVLSNITTAAFCIVAAVLIAKFLAVAAIGTAISLVIPALIGIGSVVMMKVLTYKKQSSEEAIRHSIQNQLSLDSLGYGVEFGVPFDVKRDISSGTRFIVDTSQFIRDAAFIFLIATAVQFLFAGFMKGAFGWMPNSLNAFKTWANAHWKLLLASGAVAGGVFEGGRRLFKGGNINGNDMFTGAFLGALIGMGLAYYGGGFVVWKLAVGGVTGGVVIGTLYALAKANLRQDISLRQISGDVVRGAAVGVVVAGLTLATGGQFLVGAVIGGVIGAGVYPAVAGKEYNLDNIATGFVIGALLGGLAALDMNYVNLIAEHKIVEAITVGIGIIVTNLSLTAKIKHSITGRSLSRKEGVLVLFITLVSLLLPGVFAYYGGETWLTQANFFKMNKGITNGQIRQIL